jgi:hypothetical protein
MPGFPAGGWPAGDTSCTKCGSSPPSTDGKYWGDIARKAFAWSGTYPCSEQWVGGADEYNFNGWLPAVAAQFQNLSNLSSGTSDSSAPSGWSRTVYKDASGNVRLETNVKSGQKHDLTGSGLAGYVITFLGLDKPTGACGITSSGTGGADGGPGTGGNTSPGGTGGAKDGGAGGTGGAKDGGRDVSSTGGVVGTGGISDIGGATGSGGATAKGGSTGSGGTIASGGSTGSGGVVGTGGKSGTGGSTSSGGSGSGGSGGVAGSGGSSASGGSGSGGSGSGGAIASGGSGGNNNSGGSGGSNGSGGKSTGGGSSGGCALARGAGHDGIFSVLALLGLALLARRRRRS